MWGHCQQNMLKQLTTLLFRAASGLMTGKTSLWRYRVACGVYRVCVAVMNRHKDQIRQPPAFSYHNPPAPSGPTIRNSLWALLLAASHAALPSMFPVSARQNRPALIGGQNSSRVPKSRIRNSLAVRVQLRFQSPHLHSSPWSLLTTRSPHILPLRQP